MLAGDQHAIWVMQSWLFQNKGFWKPTQAKALLTSVPLGRMIVLDLSSDVKPTYTTLESYFGQPFIWCMLHDYGGVVDWYGVVDTINNGPFVGRAFPNSTMVGIGLTMEGINQNDVIYEFMNENLWRKQPRDVNKWFSSYAFRRYGVYEASVVEAWPLLAHSIYNCKTSSQYHGKDTIIIARPRYHHAVIPRVWYKVEDLFRAWDLFVMAAQPSLSASTLYRYDLVDITRQVLQIIANKYYSDLLTHFTAKDLNNTISSGLKLLGLMSDVETLLASDEHFLLGRWLEDAKTLATNDAEKQLYEYNARNQLTLWGPRANVLDYANKQWSGMIKSYYQPRWALFVEQLVWSIIYKAPFDESQFNKDVFNKVEQPFTFDRTLWPTEPTGDTVYLTKQIHKTYRPVAVENAEFFTSLQHPQTSSQNDRSYEYGNSVQHEITYYPHVEVGVASDASDDRSIL
ncbi:Alpha-N-acetylglucosaminidase [Lamellibrachia satsuma]|nr:Alpha-N-acetylglucosaminidase [Lamellibrachia satsuma]